MEWDIDTSSGFWWFWDKRGLEVEAEDINGVRKTKRLRVKLAQKQGM